PQVGLDVVEYTWIPGFDITDRSQCPTVVRVPSEADPVLAEIGSGDLLAEEGLTDVRAEVADTGYGQHLAAPARDDPFLFRERRTRLRDPVHQEVGLLEGGEQVLTECRHDHQAAEGDEAR